MQNFLFEAMFPKCCLGCGKVGSYICERCLVTRLKPYYIQHCHVCRHEARSGLIHTDCADQSYLDGVVVGYVYNELAEKLMLLIKYQFYYTVINDVARLVAAALSGVPQLRSGMLSYVPTSAYRQRWRGFNQSQMLASQVAAIADLNCAPVLQRNNYGASQFGQGRMARLVGLRDAFVVDPSVSLPRQVILVDDVMTTGNTLEQCARILKQAGVEQVFGLVFARGWYLPIS